MFLSIILPKFFWSFSRFFWQTSNYSVGISIISDILLINWQYYQFFVDFSNDWLSNTNIEWVITDIRGFVDISVDISVDKTDFLNST